MRVVMARGFVHVTWVGTVKTAMYVRGHLKEINVMFANEIGLVVSAIAVLRDMSGRIVKFVTKIGFPSLTTTVVFVVLVSPDFSADIVHYVSRALLTTIWQFVVTMYGTIPMFTPAILVPLLVKCVRISTIVVVLIARVCALMVMKHLVRYANQTWNVNSEPVNTAHVVANNVTEMVNVSVIV
jgi:hypothetical protein